MDGSHIAIVTLLDKANELQDNQQVLETERQALEQRIKQTASQVSDLQAAISLLKSGLKQPSSVSNIPRKRAEATNTQAPLAVEKSNNAHPYPANSTLRDKLLYILHQQKRFLHSREIAENIVAHEPNEDVEKILELISKQVARYKRYNIITSITDNTGRYTFYGLPQWLDENKKPVRGYEQIFKK